MSDEEIRKFIEEQKSLQVATLNRDGSPHLTTLWFAIVDDDIVFETFTKSQKIRNLERDPRITVLLEDGTDYVELRGVSISGRAELHKDPEVVHGLRDPGDDAQQPRGPEGEPGSGCEEHGREANRRRGQEGQGHLLGPSQAGRHLLDERWTRPATSLPCC